MGRKDEVGGEDEDDGDWGDLTQPGTTLDGEGVKRVQGEEKRDTFGRGGHSMLAGEAGKGVRGGVERKTRSHEGEGCG